MNKNFTIFASLLLAAALLIGLVLVDEPGDTETNQLTTVAFRNPIPPITTGQTPLFLGKDKGFFEAQGIDLVLEQGSSELNPVKMVAAGRNDFGMLGGPETLIVARSQGMPLKAIAVLHRNSNFVALISLKESDITKLEQLNGERVGYFYGHISTDVLNALFAENDISVQQTNVGFDYGRLLSGELAAQWAFTVRAAIQLPMRGHEINIIRPQDYGVTTHGYTIFAREDFINANPELVVSFLRGLVNSVRYSITHPDEGIDLMLSLNPALDREFAELSEQVFQSVTSHSAAFPVGYMDESMFREAYDRLEKQGLLESPFDVRDVYTTEYIDKIDGRSF